MKAPKQTYPMSATSQILKIQGPSVMDSLTLMGLQEAKFKNSFVNTPYTPENE